MSNNFSILHIYSYVFQIGEKMKAKKNGIPRLSIQVFSLDLIFFFLLVNFECVNNIEIRISNENKMLCNYFRISMKLKTKKHDHAQFPKYTSFVKFH